jgi:hypothetical protein
MANENPRAAGIWLAIVLMMGAVIGAMLHQPTIGVLTGAVIGGVIALAMWLRDRKRIGR